MFRGFILSLLCLSLTGCVTTVSNLKIADSFTASELESSGIWVAGVVYDEVEFREGQDLELYGDQLTRGLTVKGRKIPVLSPKDLRVKIGEAAANNLMDEFKVGKGMDPSTLHAIATSAPDVKYIAFSRIVRNERDHEFETTPAHTDTLSSGLKLERGEMYQKRAIRTMAAGIEIYDTRTSALVFSGVRTESSTRETTYGDISGGDGFDLIDGLLSKGDSNYPAYPKEKDVLLTLFGKFGEALPRERANK